VDALRQLLVPSAIICGSADSVLGRTYHATGVKVIAANVATGCSEWPRCEELIDLDPALVMMTSGTSRGKPRGVKMPHNAVIAACESIARYLEISSTDRILMTSPISFDYGLYQLFIAALRGAYLILPSEEQRRYVSSLFEYIELQRITVLPLVPTFARITVPIWRRLNRSSPRVRVITFTGGPFPAEMVDDLKTVFPNAQVFPMYGITEAKRVSYLEPNRVALKPNSIGRPIPNCRVRILAPTGYEAKPGELGEINVEARTVMSGYYQDLDATADRIGINQDGYRFLKTGDLGYRDADGDLFWVMRNDDIVKVDDVRVSTKEVEALIRRISGVADVAVSPIVLNSRLQLGACIVSNDDKVTAQMLSQAIERIVGARAMIPVRLVLLDSLPLSEHGKTDYEEVKKILELGLEEEGVGQ